MTYEVFRAAFMAALRKSKLEMIGLLPEEKLDLRTTARTLTVHVQSSGGSDATPFFVSATVSWEWDSLLTARSTAGESELLTELLSREEAADLVPEYPRIRIDLKLKASTPWGKPLPMPSKSAWSSWARETIGRLESIEPLAPEEHVRDDGLGDVEILAWQGGPTARLVCMSNGEHQLEALSIEAMQIMTLPRTLDSDEPPDEGPDDQLREMFDRVRTALTAWTEALGHLKQR